MPPSVRAAEPIGPVVAVDGVNLLYRHGDADTEVLSDVSFEVGPGEIFGLVGESGCGKSSLAHLLIGYRAPAARVTGGEVRFGGEDLLALPRRRLDRIRGDRIGFVPQNPTTALNPGMRVGAQVAEQIRVHRSLPASRVGERVGELFRDVGLPQPATVGRRYPHQLSGGQQQRVVIAMALACGPSLLVLDEPTTGLDATTQGRITELLAELRAKLGTAMLYVTHDLALLAELADRIGVMYAGRLVEVAPTRAFFATPAHPYSRGLLGAIPGREAAEPGGRLRGAFERDRLPPGCPFAPRCEAAQPACAATRQPLEATAPGHVVACRRWRELPPPAATRRSPPSRHETAPRAAPLLAVRDLAVRYERPDLARRLLGRAAGAPTVSGVSFAIERGEVFALVGESGSGKSTIARAISGLLAPTAGHVAFSGAPLPPRLAARTREQRRHIQYVFQNPDASLNPRATLGFSLARPLRFFAGASGPKARREVAAALADVRLDPAYLDRYPDQLSGGERQRAAIARALIAAPELLLCDEILSALDVSVQADLLDLLQGLKASRGLAMLFISHDLAVVRRLADRVGVLYGGRLMEVGPTPRLFTPPFHPYTFTLLTAQPALHLGRRSRLPAPRGGREPGANGCAFAPRCPWRPDDRCADVPPPWRDAGGGHGLLCHLGLAELTERHRQQAAADLA